MIKALVTGAILSAGMVHAAVVNVDFKGRAGPCSDVGVAPDAGTTWSSGPGALVDSAGAPSGFSLAMVGGFSGGLFRLGGHVRPGGAPSSGA
jgi:hypothetical protein